MEKRIHILGASGSGTTTLGKNLSQALGIKHLDTDNFYWKKTDTAFTEKELISTRIHNIKHEISGVENWVLSGSLVSWGEQFIPLFTHVVFLYVPWPERKQRLLKREIERYGEDALQPSGKMYQVSKDFIEWTSLYDSAGFEQRSKMTHQAWLNNLPSNIKVIIGSELNEQDLVRFVMSKL